MLPTSAGVEPVTSWSPVGRASNWATEAGSSFDNDHDIDDDCDEDLSTDPVGIIVDIWKFSFYW